MIVDYEKSIVEFATSNPEGYKQIRDDRKIDNYFNMKWLSCFLIVVCSKIIERIIH